MHIAIFQPCHGGIPGLLPPPLRSPILPLLAIVTVHMYSIQQVIYLVPISRKWGGEGRKGKKEKKMAEK